MNDLFRKTIFLKAKEIYAIAKKDSAESNQHQWSHD